MNRSGIESRAAVIVVGGGWGMSRLPDGDTGEYAATARGTAYVVEGSVNVELPGTGKSAWKSKIRIPSAGSPKATEVRYAKIPGRPTGGGVRPSWSANRPPPMRSGWLVRFRLK